MSLQRVPPLSRFEESPIRRLIIERLRDVPMGEILPYRELSEIAGENIHNAWHRVTSARQALLRERIVFDVVRTMGLKRLDDDGKVAASEAYLDKTKSAARRSVKLLHASDFTALSEPAQRRYQIAEVRGGMVLQFSARRVIDRIGRALSVGSDPKRLKAAVVDTIKQFGKE